MNGIFLLPTAVYRYSNGNSHSVECNRKDEEYVHFEGNAEQDI